MTLYNDDLWCSAISHSLFFIPTAPRFPFVTRVGGLFIINVLYPLCLLRGRSRREECSIVDVFIWCIHTLQFQMIDIVPLIYADINLILIDQKYR